MVENVANMPLTPTCFLILLFARVLAYIFGFSMFVTADDAVGVLLDYCLARHSGIEFHIHRNSYSERLVANETVIV